MIKQAKLGELKPCPFCGGAIEGSQESEGQPMSERYYTVLAMDTCRGSKRRIEYVQEFETREKAVAFMNSRLKFWRGWEFHIYAHERVKKPTFRF